MEITDQTKTNQEGEVIDKVEEGGSESQAPETNPATATENPAEANTEENGQADKGEPVPIPEPVKEMTIEQFESYNAALRAISKTTRAGLTTRYNAFEDSEVKAQVKAQVIAGQKPDIKAISESAIKRHTVNAAQPAPVSTEDTSKPQGDSSEILSLKAENALLKAGVRTDRLEAATKLFLAEGGDVSKTAEFLQKYPEWHSEAGGVTYTQAPPIGGRTTPNPTAKPIMNDFERKVAAARKKAGLE